MAEVTVPSSVPKQFRAGYMPGDTVEQMQENIPGHQHKMDVQPLDTLQVDGREYRGTGKFEGKNAVITGGDSGIGRATAILFAIEGAALLIHYVAEEQKDADLLAEYFKEKLPKTVVHFIAADMSKEEECLKIANKAKEVFDGKVDVFFNNAATQNEVESILDLTSTQWDHVNKVNIYGIFWLTKALIPMMPWGSSICFNSSINPFIGHPKLLDYTTTKGAIVAFMRSLSNQIVKEKGIRANCVNPGPIWTPLVVATMGEDSMKDFGPSIAPVDLRSAVRPKATNIPSSACSHLFSTARCGLEVGLRPISALADHCQSIFIMAFSKALPQTLKELRVHMCQTGASSNGLRQFILASYPAIKAANPDLKVLIREARGVEPRVFARFERGRESQISLSDASKEEVEQKLGQLVTGEGA